MMAGAAVVDAQQVSGFVASETVVYSRTLDDRTGQLQWVLIRSVMLWLEGQSRVQ